MISRTKPRWPRTVRPRKQWILVDSEVTSWPGTRSVVITDGWAVKAAIHYYAGMDCRDWGDLRMFRLWRDGFEDE